MTDQTTTDPKLAPDPAPLSAPCANLELSAAEIQELKELAAVRRRALEQQKARELPELSIDDADRDRFAEHLWSNAAFTQDFSALDGKFTAILRLRTKSEMDLIGRQVDQDYRDGLFGTPERQQNAVDAYNLRFQLATLNGQAQDTVYPKAEVKRPSVRQWTEQSVIESLSEARLAILLNWLHQFESKATRLWREALAPNFTQTRRRHLIRLAGVRTAAGREPDLPERFARARRHALYDAMEDDLILQLQAAELRRAFAPDGGTLNEARRSSYLAWLESLVPYEDWKTRLGPPTGSNGTSPVDADMLEMTRLYREHIGNPSVPRDERTPVAV